MSRPDSLHGSSPTKAPKAKKEFSSVIEQAMHRRAISSRPMRSSPTQREDASPGPERAKVARSEIHGTNETDVEGPTTDRLPEQAKRVHECEHGSLALATDAETPAPADDTVASEASGTELSALPDGLPQNVIPFPTPSVIIPFPLVEAKAMGSSARAVDGARVDEALGTELSVNVERSTLNGERSIPTADGSGSKPDARVSSYSTDGLDISGLGLAPVEELEKPTNVHRVEFPSAPAQEDAAQNKPAVISVVFRPAQPSDEPQPPQTQLPSQPGASEESAPKAGSPTPVTEARPLRADSTKTAVGVVLAEGAEPRGTGLAGPAEVTGISAARQKGRMKSPSNSESATPQAMALTGREPVSLAESPETASRLSHDKGEALDFSARTLSAMEWQTGRPVSSSDRPSSDTSAIRTMDTTGTVERISKLVLSEVALIKQHSSDSLAVVLRPDAETELFVHLTQRNGQIEATIRCERGDLQHLGALWGQLQESLAQQKVRLAPLEPPPSNHSNFHQTTGSDANSGQGSSRQSPPEKQSMDEWPTPAPSSTDSAHVRGRGGSRHRRLTTSRPGWETWA